MSLDALTGHDNADRWPAPAGILTGISSHSPDIWGRLLTTCWTRLWFAHADFCISECNLIKVFGTCKISPLLDWLQISLRDGLSTCVPWLFAKSDQDLYNSFSWINTCSTPGGSLWSLYWFFFCFCSLLESFQFFLLFSLGLTHYFLFFSEVLPHHDFLFFSSLTVSLD